MKEKLTYWQSFWQYQLINTPLTLCGMIVAILFFTNPWVSIFSIEFYWINALRFTISVTAVLLLTQIIPIFYIFQSKSSPHFLKWFYVSLYTVIIPGLILTYLIIGI